MMKIKNTRRLLISGLLLSLTACGINSRVATDNPIPNNLSSETIATYNNGKGILLFKFEESAIDSEAYADWAEYLNEFKSANNSDFLIHEINNQEKAALNIATNEFTIFLKRGYPSYFYNGYIVEPQVYTAVHKVYTKQELSSMDKSFLPEELCIPHASAPEC